ncbi:unnamed protein product [Schistosoma mattheei]|uniref:Uncharacterized protein n=1 Tax=Schistosoma mattheei TaxID=31246 RepID=A0A3P8CDD6_9TREM|nr:unnamed protein product [Schistosoma mattheei]
MDPMSDLMLQNSADQQSLLVGQTLDMIRNLMSTSQKVTQGLLIEGASPITFQTSNGVISLSKILPNNLSNRIAVLDGSQNDVFVNNLCRNLQASNESCSEPYSLQTFISKTNLFSFRAGSSIPIPFHTETISMILYNNKPVIIKDVKEIVEGIVHRLLNFKQPTFTSMDPGTNRPQLPAARIAVDKTEIYQALLMSHQVVPDDVAVFFQLYPENISECPQYLLFLR